MHLIKPLLFCLVLGGALLPAAAALAEGGNGERRGGGGGAPAPLIGVTLLGQASGLAGMYAAWRKRRKKDDE